MKDKVSWLLLLVLAISLIVIGFQGSLGKVLGSILTPTEMVING